MAEDPTQLLTLAQQGDAAAARALTPIVYEELRRLAAKYLGGGGAPVTLQPTVLVHEAFIRLIGQDQDAFAGRTHFYAVAAVAMRHVLIDHVRARNRAKRGGGWKEVTLSGVPGADTAAPVDPLVLEEALEQLAQLDERAARGVVLRFFGGLNDVEIAEQLGVSERTVRNDWSMARAWLRCRIGEDPPAL
jgi:RNA polymerase sigma factor (TIGR02999 family)